MTEKVLLVDDEEDFLDVLAERIRTRGMDVETSTSAAEALAKADETSYDAIVLDLMMPGVDGLEALKALKERRPELQVILLTGHASVQKGIEAMKLGATDFLEKPAEDDRGGKADRGEDSQDHDGKILVGALRKGGSGGLFRSRATPCPPPGRSGPSPPFLRGERRSPCLSGVLRSPATSLRARAAQPHRASMEHQDRRSFEATRMFRPSGPATVNSRRP